jgi:N-acetylglucosaminyldiphosphoundecaprenol N-acetyl-beta-D-mannosaminyltransferase
MSKATAPRPSKAILGMRVDATSYTDVTRQVIDWAQNSVPAYVCVANVHMVMEAYDSGEFRSFVNNADLVTPDGMPLVLGLRSLGVRTAQRVYGPDLTEALLREAAARGLTVGFYGSTPEVLNKLIARIREKHPDLSIGLVYSPPFRSLTPAEDAEEVRRINDAGVQILFVGLGCPKQERWMAGHRDRIRPVMLGVGAAFDFLAGNKAQAPRWVMKLSLEWLFRLAAEPKRLWRRYLKQNPRFMFLFSLQLASTHRQMKGQL